MSQICKADEESFAQAKQILARGGLVVMPTDTVYGIVCDPCNPEAIARIYQANGRPQSKALQVIMAAVDGLDALGLALPSPLNRLASQFLPGEFSPIAVARDSSPLATVRVAPNGARTQGIRVPNSVTALAMLRVTGPVARAEQRHGARHAARDRPGRRVERVPFGRTERALRAGGGGVAWRCHRLVHRRRRDGRACGKHRWCGRPIWARRHRDPARRRDPGRGDPPRDPPQRRWSGRMRVYLFIVLVATSTAARRPGMWQALLWRPTHMGSTASRSCAKA